MSSNFAGALKRAFYGWGYKICCKKCLVMKIIIIFARKSFITAVERLTQWFRLNTKRYGNSYYLKFPTLKQ